MRSRLTLFLLSAFIVGLFLIDMLVATRSQMIYYPDPAPDAYFYETGSDTADYPLDETPVSSQVVLLRSDNAALSAPADHSAELTPEQIEEMVWTALEMDTDQATGMPNLQKVIAGKRAENGDSCWVVLKINLVYTPGVKHTLSDQTDPRVARAVLRYLAEKTEATRISFLACGGYPGLEETGIFTMSDFGGGSGRWNSFFQGLPDDFTLDGMVREIQAETADKLIDMINLNYDELYTNGLAYREMDSGQRSGAGLAYIPVPQDNGLGALHTSNVEQDNGCYNVTKAVYNSDVLVNVPKLKTTGDVVINCVFKNYIGSVSRGVYGYDKNRTSSLGSLDHVNLYKTCLNLFSFHPSDYVLVDALHSLEGEGSHPYKSYTGYIRRNFLVASSDPVAVESVCAQSMGFHPGDIEMLRWARAKGWGCYEPNRIRVVGDELASVTMQFKPAIGEWQEDNKDHYFYGRGCTRWLVCGPFDGRDLSAQPAGIDPAVLDPVEGVWTGGKAWTSYISPGTLVDLAQVQALVSPLENSTVYAFTRIYSSAARSGKLWVGASEGIKVWVNGEFVVDKPDNLGYEPRKIEADLSLAKGDNRVLVRLANTSGDFGFSLACVDDGSNATRQSYVPYVWSDEGWNALGSPIPFSAQDKKKYFGGRTLSGTFYHLAKAPAEGGEGSEKECDIDANGRVNIADVIACILLMRREPDNPAWDWNGDGRNDVADALALLRDIMQGNCAGNK
ncbi:MAG TPA: DUF362 domain-containing protein [archaeon]|nr:DUF362 domain-containing protein [archaeon]